METPTAKKLAAQRHAVMEQFIVQFRQEWNPGNLDVS